jgi:hypothetical protein
MSTDVKQWSGTRPRQRDGLVQVAVDGETIVYEETTQTLHRLDQRGSLVWGCLDGIGTVEEISRDIAEVFGIDESTVRQDVDALLDRLHEASLLAD